MSTASPVSLVTGANRGIGRETARQLAALGHTVLLCARRLEDAEQAVADLAPGVPGTLLPYRLDVTDADDVITLARNVEKEFGLLDILVNNAAINYDTAQRAVFADLDEVRRTLETNLFGAWRTAQTFLPLLRRSPHPRLVNVSSESGSLEHMSGGTPAYGVSKAALNTLTRKLADELLAERILVNAVCPGWIATDMGGPGGGPVEQGAASVVWAATLPDSGPTGGFFREGEPLAW
ncbi:SDR family oxidoreductase [Streptomyces caelestis]|uniref:NAD(P)-dependent dehydrogenase (Short-subunit alcohol dehydrogenase family) n=1 Tax=Streptomyces caelestis TaxID=36816 RepID=A0A7W9LQB0_9ACTN|nr:SDR family oxidoreductase [Streptomyces caelestis]MBB5792057.1 NAD(P)-dependent dehydrogenase (short-subunit alcohol dehydrogenase family) [Streptomyces caelestis]MBB5800213.1 NAD(P)-dependent dehydrogenase (short-subunit alcohol dehydrogenase family) [Streptomyces caelestis]GGW87790.1 short-chain dehydrogenase [Streptomyces caelestis]